MGATRYNGCKMLPIIAQVILDPGFGGGHRQVLEVARVLGPRLQSVIFASSPVLRDRARQVGLPLVPLPESRFFGMEDVAPLRGFLTSRLYALVHAHGPRAGWVTALANRGVGLPFVYTDHAWNPDYTIAPFNAAIQLIGLRLVCRAADRVIAVSERSRTFLVDRGISPADKTIVIPNGIRLPAAARKRKTENPVAQETMVVGSVGAFHRRKGHDLLVRAIPHVLASLPDTSKDKIRFVIVGDGPERVNVAKLAIRLGVRRYLHLPGSIPDQELEEERRRWTVYVQASRDESFGIAAAEALALGIPVVATGVGGLPEVVDGGGLIVPKEDPRALAEAVVRLLSEETLRRKLSEAGREHVRSRYDVEKVAGEIERVYQELLAHQ